jgi:hypothetical protein
MRVGVAVLVVLVCIWLYSPALYAGYLADDLFQISMFEGFFGEHQPWNLYSFARGDAAENAAHAARGSLPWWTVPHFRFSMLRPLSSCLIYLDHALFPRQAVVHHIHSFLWFFAGLYVVYRFIRAVAGESVALMAVAAFSIDETMAWMVAWIANRCALVCLVFSFLALLLHHRHAEEPTPKRRALELAAWGLAFMAGEYAVGGIAYLVAYEIVLGRGRALQRVRALWPGMAALALYGIAYVAGDFGVYGASTYIDPISDPFAFLSSAGERIPRMAGEVWTGMAGESERFLYRYHHTGLVGFVMPNDGADVVTQAWRHARFALVTTLAFVGGAWALARRWWTPDERRRVRFFVLGSTFALVPIAAIPPATRALMFANLGSSVFVAFVLVATFRAWRAKTETKPTAGLWARRVVLSVWALAFVYVHGVRERTYVNEQMMALSGAQDSYDEFYGNPPFAALDLRGKHVVVIATPGLVTGIHGLSMLNLADRPLPKTWHVLAMGRRPYLVRRMGPRAIELDSVGGPMQLSPQEVLFRSRADAMKMGEQIDVGLFRAKVVHVREATGPDGIVFTFDRRLDDPSLVFLDVGPEGLRPFPIPPRGKTIAVQPPLLPQVVPRG